MEPQDNSIELHLLPKRNTNKSCNLRGEPMKFHSNYYEIKLNPKSAYLYQYSLDCQNVPQDDTDLLYRLVKSKKQYLKEKIGLVAFKGSMIWGNIKNSSAILIQAQDEKYDNKKYELLIRLSKTIFVRDLLSDSKTSNSGLQIININIKGMLRKMDMIQLTKGCYFNRKQFEKGHLESLQLKVCQGFKVSLSLIWGNPYIQIDKCFRILRENNFLQEINNAQNRDLVRQFIGSSVITKYGNHKIYKIKNIIYDKCPRDKFQMKNQKGSITYADYYKDQYNIKVKDLRQPLIQVEKSSKNKNKTEENIIFLIPQLISLTGIPEEILKDYKKVQQITDITKILPQIRVYQNQIMIKQINKDQEKMFQIKQNLSLNGIILNQPSIQAYQNQLISSRDGSIKLIQPILDPVVFDDCYLVYFEGREDDYYDSQKCLKSLKDASKTFKIGFIEKNINLIKIKRPRSGQRLDVDEWKRQIDLILSQRKNKAIPPQILVFFLGPNEVKYYSELKKYATYEKKCPSQFIKKNTILKAKNLTKASKIILQMNAKVGKPLWSLHSTTSLMKDKNVMYGGLSGSKGKAGYSVSFVGTKSLKLDSFWSDFKVNKGWKKRQDVNQGIYEAFFSKWGRTFYFQNKKKVVPDVILLYREGLSEQQVKTQLPIQLRALQKMIDKFKNKIGVQTFKPDIVYFTASKKINTRIFEKAKQGQMRGKMAPEYRNPPSGSVVTSQLSVNNSFDFHLIPQHVTSGTCTPTLYRIVYKTPGCKITEQDLITFTFQQCFNYFNWTGAVRVPGCLQNADKLAKFSSEHMHKDGPQDEQLQKKLYFL